MAFGLKTYSDVADREDLLDILKDISPENISFDKLISQKIEEAKQNAGYKVLKNMLEEET